VFSCPANSKNAVNGMVPPSESRLMAPTGNLAHAENAVKRLRARRCLIVPGRHHTSYYDVLWIATVVRGAAREEKTLTQRTRRKEDKAGRCGVWERSDNSNDSRCLSGFLAFLRVLRVKGSGVRREAIPVRPNCLWYDLIEIA
jgi:hypothetical protein